jgi:hypothetical protein
MHTAPPPILLNISLNNSRKAMITINPTSTPNKNGNPKPGKRKICLIRINTNPIPFPSTIQTESASIPIFSTPPTLYEMSKRIMPISTIKNTNNPNMINMNVRLAPKESQSEIRAAELPTSLIRSIVSMFWIHKNRKGLPTTLTSKMWVLFCQEMRAILWGKDQSHFMKTHSIINPLAIASQ